MAKADLINWIANPPDILADLCHMDGVFLVGGCLRDAWLKRPCNDYDLVVSGCLDHALSDISMILGAEVFELGWRHSSHRLVRDGVEIDISPMHPQGIAADLLRRDYTVNSLAVPVTSLGGKPGVNELVFAPGAENDLASGTARMVSRDCISDDPLRIIRGYRLCAELGFIPDPDTRSAWKELASKAAEPAPERIHEELVRWFGQQGAFIDTLEWCAEDEVLWSWFHGLEHTRKCQQNAYHHLGVWHHTLEAMNCLGQLLGQVPRELAPFTDALGIVIPGRPEFDSRALAILRVALLLHDVAKPDTAETQEDGHITFYGHQEAGAEQAASLLEGLRFSKDETALACLLIKEHLRLGFYSDHDPMPPKLIYRFIRKLGDATPLMLVHSIADCMATKGPLNEHGLEKHIKAAETILKHYVAKDQVAAPTVFLDGNEIMDLLGIKPSKLVGELKDALLEATAEGEVETRQQAEAFIRAAFGSGRP